MRPLIAAAGVLLAAAAPATPSPSPTSAARGALRAQEHGCLQCHSPGNTAAPGWENGADSLVADEAEAREWILQGLPKRMAALPPAARPTWTQPMPAYAGKLGPGELEVLQAWFQAVSGFDTAIPDPAFEGRVLATRLGCFGCHGPSGLGTPTAPGWETSSLAARVRDEGGLREWILQGRTKRSGPTKMPAFAKDLSDDQLELILAYLRYRTSPSPGAPSKPAPARASLESDGADGADHRSAHGVARRSRVLPLADAAGDLA
ncbi:MAG: c-type cytochrome [Myxococcales bacterium]